MAGQFLNIPGNVKQRMLPFVLDPANELNSAVIDVAYKDGKANLDSGVGTTQLFSFKPSAFKELDDKESGPAAEKSGFLRIAPASFYYENDGSHTTFSMPNNDLSYKLIYGSSLMSKDKNQQLNAVSLLDAIPSITVREYLQDSKLNNVINLFQSIVGGWDQGTKMAEQANESSFKNFADKLWTFTKTLMQKMPSILENASKGLLDDIKPATGNDDSQSTFILKLPYALYYQMLSTTSTNIYQLPWNGKVMYESDGTKGWNTTNGLDGAGVGGNSVLGQIFNYAAGNIKVNTTPTWTPVNDNTPIKMDFTFDLYNDTLEAALKNFIFINTIVPGSKFLQYHIYQHSPNLYDVRIDGVMRLFMCAATFKVEGIGVMRTASEGFYERLAKSHRNNKYSIEDPKDLQKYIRVPDIYRVTVSFQSLLPDSFNNYIYQYYINKPIKTLSGKSIRTQSKYEQFSTNLVEEIATVWNEAAAQQAEAEAAAAQQAEAEAMGAADAFGEGFDYENGQFK